MLYFLILLCYLFLMYKENIVIKFISFFIHLCYLFLMYKKNIFLNSILNITFNKFYQFILLKICYTFSSNKIKSNTIIHNTINV